MSPCRSGQTEMVQRRHECVEVHGFTKGSAASRVVLRWDKVCEWPGHGDSAADDRDLE